MENLKSFRSHLEDLRSKAKNLTETGLALNALFGGEEARLNREDRASVLKAVYSAIVEQSKRLKEIEASSRRGHSQANLILSLGELAVTAIVSKGKRLSVVADYLLRSPTDRQPFGLVMVCIGPGGLPDDVESVSISQSARESRRSQPEIINKLQEDGYLLFTEEAFSLLIDRLIDDIRAGKLNLPVSRDELAEVIGLSKPKPGIKLIEAK